jgi:UDP-glucose 4-epimerase
MPTAIVTGGAGFVGSHLVDRLLAEGKRTIVVDDLSTGVEGRVNPEAELEVLDVTNFDALSKLVEAVAPEAIYHLAAQAVVTVSVRDPWFDADVNVKGTLNVLQAARAQSAPVVFASTGGAIYGDDAPRPTPETVIPEPLSPYGASKLAGEVYVRTWAASDGIPHAICRLGNVYGPRQSPDGEAGVVAIFSHRLWSGEPATLYGDGEATRDYVHVADVADALLKAKGIAGVFNISVGREAAVKQVFELLRGEAGVESEPVLAPLRDGELERSCIDPSLAGERLGWKAATSLEDGLPETYRALVAEFEASSAP